MTGTIMLIHGAWLNSVSWEHFRPRYEARGFAVIAPDWPYDDRPPSELRTAPLPELASLGQREIIAHYEKLVRALPEPPILIGHSFGGVIVQHLLDRGLGSTGVAIDPAPTPGVGLGPHAIVSALPVFLDLGSWRRAKTMTRKFFRNRFAQTAPTEQSDELYDRYIIPTPGKVYWDGIVNPPRLRWDNPDRPPLLLIAGGKDLIADASMTEAIYRKQKRAPSLTELKIFPNRSHWTCMDGAGRRSPILPSTGRFAMPRLPSPHPCQSRLERHPISSADSPLRLTDLMSWVAGCRKVDKALLPMIAVAG